MWSSKPKQRGHSCSKRKHGQPKLGQGICHDPGAYRQAVSERIACGRLEREWLRAARSGIDLDDVDL
jgi:hypothetical protein